MNLNGVQFKVELQLEIPKIAGTSKVIDTDDDYSEVEHVKPIVAVTTNIAKVRIRFSDSYGYNDGFVLSMIEEVVLENLCGAVKCACRVGVLMRFTVMVKCFWQSSPLRL